MTVTPQDLGPGVGVSARSREPWLAASLSLLLPGVGHLYAGRRVRGVVVILAAVALGALTVGTVLHPRCPLWPAMVLALLGTGLTVLSIVDAHRTARAANTEAVEGQRRSHKDGWVAVFLTGILPGVGHFYLGRIAWGLLFLMGWLVLGVILPSPKGASAAFVLSAAVMALVRAVACYHAFLAAPARRSPRRHAAAFAVAAGLHVFVPCAAAHGAKTFWVEAFAVSGGSMEPTLNHGDCILTAKCRYVPRRDDVVAYRPPGRPGPVYVQRIVAVGGDVVVIQGERFLVNGRPADDRPTAVPAFANAACPCRTPYTVPEGHVFVLGDNRERAFDSRYTGPVPVKDVLGRATKIYWPPARAGPVQ